MTTVIHQTLPDEQGRFGDFGGKFVPETVMAALTELEDSYRAVQDDAGFAEQLDHLMRNYAGRPTALYYAKLWNETKIVRILERAQLDRQEQKVEQVKSTDGHSQAELLSVTFE